MTQGKARIYTQEQLDFIEAHRPILRLNKLVEQTNTRFNENFTTAEISRLCKRKGWQSSQDYHIYTQEQLDFLRDNRLALGQTELASAFNTRFGTQISVAALIKMCVKNGWLSHKPGGFKKGHVPFLKGKKGYFKGGATTFKKGHKPPKEHVIGYERTTTDGFIEIKVSNEKYRRNFRFKHRLIWEHYHGKVPAGFVVKFKDGNKTNFDIENLELVSKREHLELNKIDFSNQPVEIKDTLRLLVKLDLKTQGAT